MIYLMLLLIDGEWRVAVIWVGGSKKSLVKCHQATLAGAASDRFFAYFGPRSSVYFL